MLGFLRGVGSRRANICFVTDPKKSAGDLIRALKVSPGDYVALIINPALREDQANIDRLAFQVKRSWPGLNVLIYYEDQLRMAVIERERIFEVPPYEEE